MRTVVFDLDGTLCDVSHRRHFVAKKPKNWSAFFAGLVDDPPVENVVNLCQHFIHQSCNGKSRVRVVFCSGRGEEYRAETEEWLNEHVWSFGDGTLRWRPRLDLRMRPAKDNRPDDIIKKEMLDQLRAEGHDIWFVVDDRQRVVNMWRANGVTVLQCAPGDFDNGDPYYYEASPGECLLTLMVGPSGAGKSTLILDSIATGVYRKDQIISSDKIREEMLGDFRDQSQNDRVFAYLHDTVKTRMRYGLKTVIDATHLRKKDRLSAVALAPEGTTVLYVVVDRPLEEKLRDGGWRLDVVKDGKNLVEIHHQRMQSVVRDVLKGDGLPNVVVSDLRTLAPKVVRNLDITDRGPIHFGH